MIYTRPADAYRELKSARDSLGVTSTRPLTDIRQGAECSAICPTCDAPIAPIGVNADYIVFGICPTHPDTDPWMVGQDNKTAYGRVYPRRKVRPTIEKVSAPRPPGNPVYRASDEMRPTRPAILGWCWVCGFRRLYPQRRTWRVEYRCDRHPNTVAILYDPMTGSAWIGNGWDTGKQSGQARYVPKPAYHSQWRPG